jgi:hypothetical protein
LNQHVLGAIAGIFRRFKEARQLAEKYEYYQKQALKDDPHHESSMLKRTQVMILPFCEYFDTFEAFNEVIHAINKARKNALDLVTDLAVEKAQRDSSSSAPSRDWRIAVNGGCLHPEFDSPKGVIEDLKKKGALTSEKLEQMERKNLARRSPYPTLIIEVKSEPKSIEEEQKRVEEEKSVDRVDMVSDLSDVVKQLEAIYAKSAAMHKGSDKPSDDLFYKSIGYVAGIEEIVPVNAMEHTKEWVVRNDPRYSKNFATFLSSNLKHADSAFEFVFLNLSLHKYIPTDDDSSSKTKKVQYKPGTRSYLVLPKFASTSATSFEKFVNDIRNIIKTIKGLSDRVSVTYMHPEGVDGDRRSPSPVIILQWYDEV